MENKNLGIMEIDTVDYSYREITGNERDLMDEVTDNYSISSLDEAIVEVADSNAPIYTEDIWEYAYEMSSVADEYRKEGMIDFDDDIQEQIKQGYMFYYRQVLNENLKAMVYNVIIQQVNNDLNSLEDWNGLTEEEKETIIMEAEEFSEQSNPNTLFLEMEEKATDILEMLELLED